MARRHAQDTISDDNRRQWVDSDEGLHNWCRGGMREEGVSKREWIKRHRGEIDAVIRNVRDGVRAPHYLVYG